MHDHQRYKKTNSEDRIVVSDMIHSAQTLPVHHHRHDIPRRSSNCVSFFVSLSLATTQKR